MSCPAALELPGGAEITLPGGSVIDGDGNVTVGPGGAELRYGGLTLQIPGGAKLIFGGDSPLGFVVDLNNPFEDAAEDDWFYDYMMFAYAHGLMNGTGNGEFSPNEELSRAMLMTILARLAGQDLAGGGTWYEKALEWGVENGITDGTNPGGDITREQLATMLYRFMGSPELKAGQLEFFDAGDVSDWASDALRWAVSMGIINGKPGGLLDPQGEATRAEAAAMLSRLIAAIFS